MRCTQGNHWRKKKRKTCPETFWTQQNHCGRMRAMWRDSQRPSGSLSVTNVNFLFLLRLFFVFKERERETEEGKEMVFAFVCCFFSSSGFSRNAQIKRNKRWAKTSEQRHLNKKKTRFACCPSLAERGGTQKCLKKKKGEHTRLD